MRPFQGTKVRLRQATGDMTSCEMIASATEGAVAQSSEWREASSVNCYRGSVSVHVEVQRFLVKHQPNKGTLIEQVHYLNILPLIIQEPLCISTCFGDDTIAGVLLVIHHPFPSPRTTTHSSIPHSPFVTFSTMNHGYDDDDGTFYPTLLPARLSCTPRGLPIARSSC